MKPSAARVLDVLREHPEGITQMDALLVHGCGDSLAQRVHELRADGYDVRSAYETTARGARVVRYALHEPVTRPTTGVQIDLFSDALVGARAAAASPQPPGSRSRQVAAATGATG